jgi:tetratricopeptide (TPR) repeat protein
LGCCAEHVEEPEEIRPALQRVWKKVEWSMVGFVTLNPSFARGWYIRGILGNMAGRPGLAIESLVTSLRLGPRGRFGQVFSALGVALFFAQRFDEALAKLLLAIHDDPDFPQPHRFLAACYAHLGRLDEARAAVARLRSITPVVVMDVSLYRNPELRELLLSGLRLTTGEGA